MLLIILLANLLFLANTRFTLWPEMVAYPYLLNNDFLLYKDIINPYPPAFLGFLKIFAKIFGFQPLPYQFLTWLTILAIDLLIFFVTKKITKNQLQARVSLVFFLILSLPFGINGLWFDLVQTPFVLLSFYYLFNFFKSNKRNDLFFFALFLTFSFFIKQQAIWLTFCLAILFVFRYGKKTKEIFIKNLFVFSPFLFILLAEIIFFWKNGLLNDFIFWTYYFPFLQASKMPGYILFPSARQGLVIAALFLFFAPIILKRSALTKSSVFTGIVLVLFAYPRFDYFHLIPSLAILSLAAGENVLIFLKSNRFVRVISVSSLIVLIIFSYRFYANNLTKEIRFFEKEIYQTAAIINKVTNENEIIYIQNGPDQILPLADRLPVKPWADEFPWYLEVGSVQNRIVSSIESQNPKYIIFKPYETGGKYEIGSYQPQEIVRYIDKNYQNLIQLSETLWLKTRKYNE